MSFPADLEARFEVLRDFWIEFANGGEFFAYGVNLTSKCLRVTAYRPSAPTAPVADLTLWHTGPGTVESIQVDYAA